jgi:CHAT domain-containing protein/Flp pilus assembly protein TadD
MKGILLLAGMFLFTDSNGQLWKEYTDSAKIFQQQGKNDKAIEFYNKSKTEIEKDSTGTQSDGLVIHNLAILYRNVGQYKNAEPLFLTAKQIRENLFGKENLDYASTCNNLAILYVNMAQYEKAESLFLEVQQIREKVLGKEHPDYATSCNNLAGLYNLLAQYKKAEPFYIAAKQIREKVLGKKHPDYAQSCNNLAILYMDMGQYEKAEPLCLEAKQIRKEILGENHPDYAASCNNLANLYNYTGQYKKAEPLLLEAKLIYEKAFGKEHPNYATICNGLAAVYKEMGEYQKAESLYLEAQQVRGKMLGKEHPDYASSCDNLGILYTTIGQYDKAEPLYLEARQIRGKMMGKSPLMYATSCNNLGSLYMRKGQYDKAESFYLEAKQIKENVLGKEHPEYATSCDNLAILYQYMGQYDKGELLFLEGKQVREKTLGKEHPYYAKSCNGLAALYQLRGEFEKAEILYLETKRIREKVFGREHSDYSEICNNLAGLYWNMKEYQKANDFYIEAYKIQYNNIKRIFQFTSESEKKSYLNEIANLGKNFLSFNLSVLSSSYQGTTYDVSLSNRNLILSSSLQLRQAIYNTNDTNIVNKYNNWTNTKEQIAYWLTKPIDQRSGRDSILKVKAEVLEKELIRFSADFKKQEQQITWKNIQQSLKQNEAAIEFSEFQYFDGKRWTDSTYYIALVLRKDKSEPELVYLFEKKQMDSVAAIKDNTPNNRIDKLYSSPALYDLIWKPLENKLKGISTIYYAAAGQLHLLNLSAISSGNNRTIGDKYMLLQLNTTGSVINRSNESISTSDNVMLYGGIKYSTDSTALIEAAKKYTMYDYASRSLPVTFGGPDELEELFYSEVEVDSIDHNAKRNGFNTTVMRGVYANEESVKATNGKKSPAILHLATHGFFNPDPVKIKEKGSLAGGKTFALSDDPLMRSGILFAGANNIWSGKPIKGIEDGVLTAYEVSNLYLPNTKLVVLSACETGLGLTQGSEGVYGLQRAFKMAGVQNLIMSLWKIPDKATAEFMQYFYKQLFEKKAISDAFYSAQSIMRNKYRTTPHIWAGLVLIQ